DGQISKEELKTYFVKANNDSVNFRLGFKHNFRETTFLTPTSCSHCGRLLWGLIRQGWKCKDCGLAVHSDCKANMVAECRRKSSLVDWVAPKADVARSKLFLNYRRVSISCNYRKKNLYSYQVRDQFVNSTDHTPA
ncbi:phorbol esters/diacylglycerol binding domain protein, partial [Dictyocaulus viviparus]